MSRSNPRRGRWLILLGSLVLSSLGAELVVRALDLPRPFGDFAFLGLGLDAEMVEDPDLLWRLEPNVTWVVANEIGFRGYWPDRDHRDSDFRILCVGDSSTFGLGVAYGQTYGVQLERQIQEHAPHRVVRSVLAALPGYSTFQDRAWMARHFATVQPAVTLFYCGAWNDYLPAIGGDDAHYSNSLHNQSSSSLIRLINAAFATPKPDADAVRATQRAFSAGDAPEGRRVPLVDFRHNLEAMIQTARGGGSQVVMMVPPLPRKTRDDYPVAARYAAVVREVATTTGAELVDALALLDEFEAGCPKPWRQDVCFWDTLHPTPLGHRLIADALFERLRQIHALPADTTSDAGVDPIPHPTVLARPERLPAVEPPSLTLTGEALAAPGIADRVWFGQHWIRAIERIDATTLRLVLPDVIEPGIQSVILTSPETGLIRVPVTVEPIPVKAALRRAGDSLHVEVELRGPASWAVGLWLTTQRRAEAAITRYGPFQLQANPDGRPADRPELSFHFDRLSLPGVTGEIDADGRCRVEGNFAVGPEIKLPPTVFLQGGAIEPKERGRGVITELIELAVPR